MYLEKLQIQGFKSFATKNTLIFPGMITKNKRGITAIVGPNGSGKSNTADAIRWVLGEQSMKTLRGKKGEDVIFSGSDKKSRLGMAEVSLHLNNEDRTISNKNDENDPINYAQIVITRRLFRNGDSEYLINNSKVRLYDVQMLLSKAKFGQKTYSVIGQGMVEGFLNTTLSERKEFFDEATGVKQFQIKRDESLNKLRNSYENLNQAQMLLSEIEPRLKSLTRQVGKLQKKETIKQELKQLQLKYYGKIWHKLNNKFSASNKQLLGIEQYKRDKEKKLINLNNELSQMENDNKDLTPSAGWQQQLTEYQNQKDLLIGQLAKIEAQIEIKLESEGKFDLSWLNNKKNELSKRIEINEEKIKTSTENINPEKNTLQKLKIEKNEIDNEIAKINRSLVLSNSEINNKTDKNSRQCLKQFLIKLEEAGAESDINKIKNRLKKIRDELSQIINNSRGQKQKENFELLQTKSIKLAENKEKIVNHINEINLKVYSCSERIKLLTEKQLDIKNELASINSKLNQYKNIDNSAEIEKDKKQTQEKISNINQKIISIKEKINKSSMQEKEKRNRLFNLQKNLQDLQNEINNFNNQLNEIKINSARYETKLEDLEIEIRNSFGGLKEIKEYKIAETESNNNSEIALKEINQLKHQLYLIGGIDPEIEKEYEETKDRYDFLENQTNDLLKAINSLEQIIKELDATIKEKFDKKFRVICDKFEEYFKLLFNGGRAKIVKVTDDKKENEEQKNDPQDQDNDNKIKFLQKHNATGLAGIEIQATPPGKKIKTVSMLSGGERALTAIALICAIISANPSPFVVLDEVDAALDESNSERLSKILDDLSRKTQFIVITHNRSTMRRANILYGVSMGNDGVSKLLSIKLSDEK